MIQRSTPTQPIPTGSLNPLNSRGSDSTESLEANQADLFVHAHDKGHTLCRRSTTGKLVQLGWINGNDAGKEAFLSKFGSEKIRFSMPTTVEDMGDFI